MTIVALIRCAASDGNNGTTWTKTAVFNPDDRLGDVLHWYEAARQDSHSQPELVISIAKGIEL